MPIEKHLIFIIKAPKELKMKIRIMIQWSMEMKRMIKKNKITRKVGCEKDQKRL